MIIPVFLMLVYFNLQHNIRWQFQDNQDNHIQNQFRYIFTSIMRVHQTFLCLALFYVNYLYFYQMKSQAGISQSLHPFRYPYLTQIINNIEIISIFDPNAVKSSCAISIDVGSSYEPESAPGLAHLFEHMFFMGSQSYPTVNQYSQFLTSHGGCENAETCDFYTNYYFEISSPFFQQALMRTVDAFSRPLIPEQCINSQIQAIHEEYVLACNDDESRIQEVVRMFMAPPLNRFSIGNNKSLDKTNIKQLLVQFHKKFYSSGHIGVVLYSSVPLEFMREKLFHHIAKLRSTTISPEPAPGLRQQIFNMQVFKQKQNKRVSIRSISNQDNLKIHIPINLADNPEIKSQYSQITLQQKPTYLHSLTQFTHQLFLCVSHIITHPSQHSLSQYLSQQQISTDATIEIQPLVPFTQFLIVITVDVQQEWLDRLPEVEHKIMQYLHHYLTLQNIKGAMKQVVDMQRLEFDNYEVEDMEDFVCYLARNIYQFGLRNAIAVKNMEVNRIHICENLVKWCLHVLLNANNKIIVFSSPQNLKGMIKTQPNLGTAYIIEQYKQWKINTKQTFEYPTTNLPPNPFLPVCKTIHTPQNNPENPLKIGQNIYFSSAFSNIIRGGIKLVIYNNENYVFNLLFVQFMDLYLEDIKDVGFAELVGFQYYFHFHQGQLFLYLFGYNQIVSKILVHIGEMLGSFCINVSNGKFKNDEDIDEIFNEAVQNVIEDIDNYYEEDMDDLTDKIRDQLLLQNSPALHNIEKQLSKIKKNKFLERAVDVLYNSITQWIVVGNFQLQETEKIIIEFQNKIKSTKVTSQGLKKKNRMIKQTKVMDLSNLTKGKKIKLELRLKSQIQTSTCLSYFEAGPYSEQLFWIIQILYEYVDESYYNYLRVLKKLSYDLEVNIVNTRGIMGICFMLVSSKIDPELISREIQQFINQYLNPQVLKQHFGQSLHKMKQAVVVNMSQKCGTVEDYFDFICDEVTDRTFYFNKKTRSEIEYKLGKINENQVVETAIKIFSKSSLQIFLVAKNHKNMYSSHRPKVSSLQNIKSNADYYKDLLADLDFSFRQMRQQ